MYLPNTTITYDERCQIYQRHMNLEVQQVGTVMGCRGEECVGLLLVMGAVSAATAVVSGSVVVVGNIVYWLERQGRCIGPSKHPE